MSTGRDPWRDGRDAWERLAGWIAADSGTTKPGRNHADRDGDRALAALEDVGLGRRLLDQAELAAVRAARRQGRSWAEIATRLGVTRQSAWERWRDLDDEADARLSRVVVPNVVGSTYDQARHALLVVGLVAVGPDPDGPPLSAIDRPRAVVTDQSPESGAKVPQGSPVTLWLGRGRGGGAGVREPRRPSPSPSGVREMRPEADDEAAVG